MRSNNDSDTKPANNSEGETEIRSNSNDGPGANEAAELRSEIEDLEVEIDAAIANMETEDASVEEPHSATLSEKLEQAAQNVDINSQRPNLRPNRKLQRCESYQFDNDNDNILFMQQSTPPRCQPSFTDIKQGCDYSLDELRHATHNYMVTQMMYEQTSTIMGQPAEEAMLK